LFVLGIEMRSALEQLVRSVRAFEGSELRADGTVHFVYRNDGITYVPDPVRVYWSDELWREAARIEREALDRRR